MKSLLYLVHRIPYPPNKGDKIRSFHILKYLAKKYQIYLGAFVDDKTDWQYVTEVEKYCEEVMLLSLNPLQAKIKSLTGVISGQAMSLPYYRDANMQKWVSRTIDKFSIRQAVVFSSAMAQYIQGESYSNIKRIIDFVDVDSDKWAQYSKNKKWPMNWLYARESKYLLKYESSIASEFAISFFVSEAEADHFKQLSPRSTDKVDYFNNGVDTQFFSPQHDFLNPYVDTQINIVFTGAMDYWANVDAVDWFTLAVLPNLLAQNPKIHFYIVGSNPTDQVKQLSKHDNVTVTGRVVDIRPYLKYADIAVAPLRIARGIQNKVLEAMAMACSVVATPAAAEGITANIGKNLVVADTASKFSDVCLKLLDDNSKQVIGDAARQFVMDNYQWADNVAKLERGLNMDNETAGEVKDSINKDVEYSHSSSS